MFEMEELKAEVEKRKNKVNDLRQEFDKAENERRRLIVENLLRMQVKVDSYQQIVDYLVGVMKETKTEFVYNGTARTLDSSGYFDFFGIRTLDNKLHVGVLHAGNFSYGWHIFSELQKLVSQNAYIGDKYYSDLFTPENLEKIEALIDKGMKELIETYLDRLDERSTSLATKLKDTLDEISRYNSVKHESDGSITVIIEGKTYKAMPVEE